MSSANDAWSITSDQPLADGSYTITAIAIDQFGQTHSSDTTIVPDLVIDTVGPKVTDVFFSRLTGQIQVMFQDYGGPGNAGVGLNLSTLFDANNYSFSNVNHPRIGAERVNVISVTPGTTAGTQLATLSINGGRYIPGGTYLFTVKSVSPSDLTGVQDIAGNALDGEFYGFFPSGNNQPGGNFVAELNAVHHEIFAPATVIGRATPVSPPGTPAARHDSPANRQSQQVSQSPANRGPGANGSCGRCPVDPQGQSPVGYREEASRSTPDRQGRFNPVDHDQRRSNSGGSDRVRRGPRPGREGQASPILIRDPLS